MEEKLKYLNTLMAAWLAILNKQEPNNWVGEVYPNEWKEDRYNLYYGMGRPRGGWNGYPYERAEFILLDLIVHHSSKQRAVVLKEVNSEVTTDVVIEMNAMNEIMVLG